jgi:NAD(P) transhydrogenase subunit beta
MATGYAGVENPLFYKENTRMLFGDARASLGALLRALESQGLSEARLASKIRSR